MKKSKLAITLAAFIPLISIAKIPEGLGQDTGYANMTIGKDGEPIKVVRKPANYDVEVIEERQPDGTWNIKSNILEEYTPK